MGIAGRAKVEREFDRQIVIDSYMEEINKILNMYQRKAGTVI
jgi:galacturonosyltransferase